MKSTGAQMLKKHRRVKSQELNDFQAAIFQDTPINQTPSLVFQLQHEDTVLHKKINHKVAVPINQTMKGLKEKLCACIGMQVGQVYFWTTDEDYNFQFQLEEEIGQVKVAKKLGWTCIQASKSSNGKYLEGGRISDYFIYECLSVGGFSKVFLVRSKKSGRFYAAKFIDKNYDSSQKFKELVFNEREINQMLDYGFLAKMHRFIETKEFYVFILDYCPAGQLFCLMKKHRDMTEDQARFYFIESVLAIQYMHNQSIIYRDIKPENILLDKNGHIKIADFGLAKVMRQKSKSYCGSLEYMAPEIVSGAEHSFGVDHYCLGSLLFEMMVGCPPFYNPNFTPSQTKYHILNSSVKFPNNKNLSPDFIDLVTKLLDKNPKTRLGSLGGIKEILLHPWVGRFNRKKFEEYKIDPPFKIDLAKSNFETAYLPLDAIREVKKKICIELEECQAKQLASESTKQKHPLKNFSLSSLEKNKSKFSEEGIKNHSNFSSTNKRKQRNHEIIYKAESSEKRGGHFNIDKIKFKSESQSSHHQKHPTNFSLDRPINKKLEHSPYSISSSDFKNFIFKGKTGNDTTHTKFSTDLKKRQPNNKLLRKSGNLQKQNQFKEKLLMKNKFPKKKIEGYIRNSLATEQDLNKKFGSRGRNLMKTALANAVQALR